MSNSSLSNYFVKYQNASAGYTPYVTSGMNLLLDAGNKNSYPGSGTTWTDLSGAGNNFTLSNASFGDDGAASYITFNGSNTTGSCPNTIFGNGTTSSWTISVWAYSNSISPDPQEWVAQWSSANSGNSFFFGPRSFSGGDAAIYLGDGSAVGSINYPNQGWVNWVGINDVPGNKQYIYRNNELVGTINNKAVYTGVANTLLGHQRTAGEYFNGRLAVVQAYNRAITQAEVAQNFNFFRARYRV